MGGYVERKISEKCLRKIRLGGMLKQKGEHLNLQGGGEGSSSAKAKAGL